VVQAGHDVGYRTVRPADFLLWAMALLALGDQNTAPVQTMANVVSCSTEGQSSRAASKGCVRFPN